MSFIQVTKEEFNTHAQQVSERSFMQTEEMAKLLEKRGFSISYVAWKEGKLMKLALLGTGMIVTEVLPVLTTIEGIELEAILSTPRSLDKAEALAKQYGLSQATSDYELILSNPEVNTIYVGTPNHTHYDYAKKALLAGKHVICEKPFTLHLKEFEELAKLAQEKELLLMEAITNQYLANFTAIKEALSDIGDVKIVNINYSQYSSRYDAFKRGEIAPAFNPEMGGGAA